MKNKLVRLGLVLCMLLGLMVTGTQAATPQRVLFIGSTANQSAYYLGRVAKATGNTMEVAALIKDGGTLRHHARNALATQSTSVNETTSSTTKVNYTYTYYQMATNGDLATSTSNVLMADVLAQSWDVIVLEQNPIQAGFPGTYGSDLEFLIDYIKTKQPDAALYWNMAWAYNSYSSISDSTQKNYFAKYYDKDPARMCNAIARCVNDYILPRTGEGKDFDGCFFTGAAIQNLQAANQSPVSGSALHVRGQAAASMTILRILCPDVTEGDLSELNYSTFGVSSSILNNTVMNKVRTAVNSAVGLEKAPANLTPTVNRNKVETDSADSTVDSGYDSFTIADVPAPGRLHFPDITVLRDGTTLVAAYENVAHTPEDAAYIEKDKQTGKTDNDFYAAADAYAIEGVGHLEVWASKDGKTWDTEKPLLVVDEKQMEAWGVVDIARTYEERQQSGYVVLCDPRDPNFGLVYTDITGDGVEDEVVLLTFWNRNFKNTSASVDYLYLTWSTNGGKSWATPQKLVYNGSKAGVKRGDITSFADGEILIPTYSSNVGYCLRMKWNGTGWTALAKTAITNTEEGNAESTKFNEISFVAPDPEKDTVFAFAREAGIVFKSTDRGNRWSAIGNEAGLIHQPGFAVIDKNRVFATWADTTTPRFTYGKMFNVNGDWDDTQSMFIYGETVSSGTTSGRDMADPSSKLMANGDILVVSYDTAYRAIVGTWVPLGLVTVEQPANGDVSVDIKNGLPGETVTVTAVPNAGYALTSISVNGTDITNTKKFTIEDGDAEYIVRAQFEVDWQVIEPSGYFIDLKNSLGLTAYLDLPVREGGYTYTVNFGGEAVKNGTMSYSPNGGYSMSFEDIAAKEMRDTITFAIPEGNYVLNTSVYDVAKEWYEDPNNGDDTAYLTMLADMVAYGTAAQENWDYNTELLTSKPNLPGGSAKPGLWVPTTNVGASEALNGKVAATLSLKDRIELNVYVNDVGAQLTSVTFNGVEVSDPSQYLFQDNRNPNLACFKFDDLAVKDVKGVFELVIKLKDGTEGTVRYSIADYVLGVSDNSKEKPLFVALQKYVDSVIDYFVPQLDNITADADELRIYRIIGS